jgi:hypothetical protein
MGLQQNKTLATIGRGTSEPTMPLDLNILDPM